MQKNTFDKELRHRPFVFKCEKTNTQEVNTGFIFLLVHT